MYFHVAVAVRVATVFLASCVVAVARAVERARGTPAIMTVQWKMWSLAISAVVAVVLVAQNARAAVEDANLRRLDPDEINRFKTWTFQRFSASIDVGVVAGEGTPASWRLKTWT